MKDAVGTNPRKELVCVDRETEGANRYVVPLNFSNGAKVFGMFNTRNIVEAGILVAGLAYLEWTLISSSTVKLVVICVTCIPAAILGAVGLGGCSLSEYVIKMFKSLTNKKYMVRKEDYADAEEKKFEGKARRKENPGGGRKKKRNKDGDAEAVKTSEGSDV